MENSEYVNLIYTSSETYWLASSCVYAYFYDGYAVFFVRYVDSSGVDASNLFNSYDGVISNAAAVRPVVSLTTKIQKNSATGSCVWEFVS